MNIDRAEFRNVAKAIIAYNNRLPAEYRSIDLLVNYMVGIAYAELGTGSTFAATAGFMLTAYKDRTGEITVKASVSASLFSDLPELVA